MLKFIFGFSLDGESLFPCKSRNWAKIESFEVFFVGPKSNSGTESCDESFGFFRVQFQRAHPSLLRKVRGPIRENFQEIVGNFI